MSNMLSIKWKHSDYCIPLLCRLVKGRGNQRHSWTLKRLKSYAMSLKEKWFHYVQNRF